MSGGDFKGAAANLKGRCRQGALNNKGLAPGVLDLKTALGYRCSGRGISKVYQRPKKNRWVRPGWRFCKEFDFAEANPLSTNTLRRVVIVGNCDSDRIRLESTAQRNGFTFLSGLLVNDLFKTRPGCAAVGRKLEREGAGFGVVGRSVIESPDDEVGNLI